MITRDKIVPPMKDLVEGLSKAADESLAAKALSRPYANSPSAAMLFKESA